MASAEHQSDVNEPVTLPDSTSRRMLTILAVLAVAGLAGALFLAFPFNSQVGGFTGGMRRFFLSYLAAYGFVLSIALGGLFFVMLQHVTRAGWSVNVRRIPEALANTMPALAVLSIPILLTLLFPGYSGAPTLYPWAASVQAEHASAEEAAIPGQDDQVPEIRSAGPAAEPSQAGASEGLTGFDTPLLTREAMTVAHAKRHLEYDALTKHKAPYLNRPFFALRIVIYFGVWIAIAAFYWRNSVLQDRTGDPALTTRMQKWAPLCILAYAFTVTGAAFDLWMSIDPHFFSTIWAVYIFAGGVLGSLAVIILIYEMLQGAGFLKGAVSREHFHDLGKLLFAFVFFWGYIAFSQFLLIWYANIPETTYWFGVRGATTVSANLGFGAWPSDPMAAAPVGWWAVVSLILLFGHLLIPFGGLLSRHPKRRLGLLAFWAVWMLVMHYIDHYWLIMPEAMVGSWAVIPLPEIACLLFMVGAVGAYFVWTLSRAAIRPVADPRVHESMAFHNI